MTDAEIVKAVTAKLLGKRHVSIIHTTSQARAVAAAHLPAGAIVESVRLKAPGFWHVEWYG